jgi:DNA-binding NtrC family response regulator
MGFNNFVTGREYMNAKRILVVDDDEAIRDLLEMFLEENGCKVVTEGSAENAMAIVRHEEFDLILLDIMLGEISGMELLKHFKKISPQVPVIMITGNCDIQLAEKCLLEGANDYISKPFDLGYLRDSVLASLLA